MLGRARARRGHPVEGLVETLTINRLGVPPTLARTLRSTNAIESMIAICRDHSSNVKRRRDGTMVLRKCAAGNGRSRGTVPTRERSPASPRTTRRARRALRRCHTPHADTHEEEAAWNEPGTVTENPRRSRHADQIADAGRSPSALRGLEHGPRQGQPPRQAAQSPRPTARCSRRVSIRQSACERHRSSSRCLP